jgi:hypothetical protein
VTNQIWLALDAAFVAVFVKLRFPPELDLLNVAVATLIGGERDMNSPSI